MFSFSVSFVVIFLLFIDYWEQQRSAVTDNKTLGGVQNKSQGTQNIIRIGN